MIKEPPKLDISFNNQELKDFERNQIIYQIEERLKKFKSLNTLLDRAQPISDVLPKLQKFYQRNKNPKDLAAKARKLLYLGDSPILDIVHLLVNRAGIEVIPFHSEFDIFSASIPGINSAGAAICINTRNSITAERQIFSCAHELGHLIRGKCNSDQMKDEINVFAGNFLAPEKEVIDKLKESMGLHILDQVIQVKNHFSISYRTLLHRVSEKTGSDYHLLKESFIKQYFMREGKVLGDSDEPAPVPRLKFKEGKLNAMVREAYEKEKISTNEAAEILEISEYKFNEIKNSWEIFNLTTSN